MTDVPATGSPPGLEWIGSVDAGACTDEGCSVPPPDDAVAEPEGSDHAVGSGSRRRQVPDSASR